MWSLLTFFLISRPFVLLWTSLFFFVCHKEDGRKEQLGIPGTTFISDGFVCILGNSKTNAPYVVYMCSPN